jgi:hypothetical protein
MMLHVTIFAVDILRELDKLDTVLVAAAGNKGATEDGVQDYPAKFLETHGFSNLIVVGATDRNCRRALFSSQADWVTTYAP